MNFNLQEEQNSEFPRDNYVLDVAHLGFESFSTTPYASNINLSLPVGQEEAEAVMQRYYYFYNESTFEAAGCENRWFEVGVCQTPTCGLIACIHVHVIRTCTFMYTHIRCTCV